MGMGSAFHTLASSSLYSSSRSSSYYDDDYDYYGRHNRKVTKPVYTDAHYLIKEIVDGDSFELSDFFKKLYSCGEEILEEDYQREKAKYDKNINNIKSKFYEYFVRLRDLEEKLHSLNVHLGDSRDITDLSVDDSSVLEVFDSFNGLHLSEFYSYDSDIFSNLKKSDDSIEKREKGLRESAIKIRELKEQLGGMLLEKADVEKSLKFPFYKDAKLRRLEDVQRNIFKINKMIQDATVEFETIQKYQELSEEQKLAIIEYLMVTDELMKLNFDYSNLKEYAPYYYSYAVLSEENSHVIDSDIWYRSLSRVFERENIDLSYVEQLFSQIQNAIQKWKNQDSELSSDKMNLFIGKYKKMIDFFLENIYYSEYDDVLVRRVHYSDMQEEAKVKTK